MVYSRNTMNDSQKEKVQSNTYTCSEYREEMMLAGLRKRIAQKDLLESERTEIEKEIHRLEEVMGF
jgi:hypothetical protein